MRAPFPCPACKRSDAASYSPGRYPVDGRETAICLRAHDGGGPVVFFVDDGTVAVRRKRSVLERAWDRCTAGNARGIGGHFLDDFCHLRILTASAIDLLQESAPTHTAAQVYAAKKLMEVGPVTVAPLWDGLDVCGWELRAVDAERGIRPGDAHADETGKLTRMLGQRGLYIPSRFAAPKLAVIVVEGIWDAVCLQYDLWDTQCQDLVVVATGGASANPRKVRRTLDIYWHHVPALLLPDADEAGLQLMRGLVIQDRVLDGSVRLCGIDAKDYRAADRKTRLDALLTAVERELNGPTEKPSRMMPVPAQHDPRNEVGEASGQEVVDNTHSPTAAADCVSVNVYSVQDGKTVWISEKFGSKELANFVAEILEEITVDDGAQRRVIYRIGGRLASGGRLPDLQVASEDFAKMAWVCRWGASAIPAAGPAAAHHLRAAIQSLSRRVERSVVYAHSGWVQREDGSIFLHGSGAIGANGPITDVHVELPGKLADYSLPSPLSGRSLLLALEAVLGMLDVDVDSVTVPLLGIMVRSVLGHVPYTVHLVGRTGQLKSTKVALFLSLFGSKWRANHLPSAWTDTPNSLAELQFLSKDIPLVIDDAVFEGTARAVQELKTAMARILRGQANAHSRSRLNRDFGLLPSRDPRGALVSTGEDEPSGHSIQARSLIVQVPVASTRFEALTLAQEQARKGIFASVMASYIQWLAPQIESMRSRHQDRLQALLNEFQAPHRRTPEIMADLFASLEIFGEFLIASGIPANQASDILKRAKRALHQLAEAQVAGQKEADPVRRFIACLHGGLASGRCHVESIHGGPPKSATAWGWRGDQLSNVMRAQGPRIGFVSESDRLHLLPDPTWQMVVRLSTEEGDPLSLSQRVMWKRLHEAGHTWSPESDRIIHDGPTVDGIRYPVVCLPGFMSLISAAGKGTTFPSHQTAEAAFGASSPNVPNVPKFQEGRSCGIQKEADCTQAPNEVESSSSSEACNNNVEEICPSI